MQNKKFRESYVRSLFFVSLLLCLIGCVVFFGYSAKTNTIIAQTKEPPHKRTVKVFSNVDKLDIVNSQIEDDRFSFTLRNRFDKNINSFYYTSGERSSHTTLIYSDFKNVVGPGEEHNFSTELREELYTNGLTILAILFEDGTGAGEPQTIQKMQDERKGVKLELIRGKQLIDDLLTTNSAKSKLDIERVKTKFLSPISIEKLSGNESEDDMIETGKGFGRQRFLKCIDDLLKTAEVNGTNRLEPDITKVGIILEKYIAKL